MKQHESKPPWRTTSPSAVRAQWGDVLERVARRESRFVVERGGVRLAAVISPDDLDRFEAWERERQAAATALYDLAEAFREVPAEELERQVAAAVAEARAERQAAGPLAKHSDAPV